MTESKAIEGLVVLGAPRSGTTLLRRLVNSHPALCCPSETNLLIAASRFIREDMVAGGVGVGVLTGLKFSGFSEEETLGRIRDLVFGILREIADGEGCELWAEKTAFNAFYVDEIERICGDRCKYILVVRHPLDSVCSQKELADKMELYLPEVYEFVRGSPSVYEGLARAWDAVNRRLLEFRSEHPDLCVTVKYEDLAADPESCLERIFEFIDRPIDLDGFVDAALGRVEEAGLGDWKTYQTKKVHKKSVGRWRGLSRETLSRIIPIVEKTGRAFGFSDLEAGEQVTDEDAAHRYQLGMMAAQMRGMVNGSAETDQGETGEADARDK